MEGIREEETGEKIMGKIVYRDDQYFATLGDDAGVPVEGMLAQNIGLALQAQERLDRDKGSNDFRHMISLLNCRQTISVVRNITQLRSQLDNNRKVLQKDLSSDEKKDTMEKLSGVPELESDVDRILSLGRRPIFGFLKKNTRRYLESHPADLPAVVHIFVVDPDKIEIIQSLQLAFGHPASFADYKPALGRVHSFLVLGKDQSGRYVCFEKSGPDIDDRFEIVELELTRPMFINQTTDYLAFIGPISK